MPRSAPTNGRGNRLYACSAGYDVRIVFEFFRHKGAEAIQLVTIGTHDDVYY